MAAPTYEELRDSALAAIYAIQTTGQSVTADGRTLTHASLPELRENLKMWNREIARASRGGAVRPIAIIGRA